MIGYRNTDVDLPFFWDSDRQPPARWHGAGEGPVQYLSTSLDASWAEFLRHAGITEVDDLAGVERTMWVLEIDDDEPMARPTLGIESLIGDEGSYATCQAEARRLRTAGVTRIEAPCAAIQAGSPRGWVSGPEMAPGPPADERTIVLVGQRHGQRADMAAHVGRPHPALLGRVRHF